MLEQPPKVIISLAAIFVAIIAGLAYMIFSFMPYNNSNRSSIEGPVDGVTQVQPALTDSTYCGDKSIGEIPQCCSEWVNQQKNVTIDPACTPEWSLDNGKNCVYTCASASELPPI